jgi:hypothetical protein
MQLRMGGSQRVWEGGECGVWCCGGACRGKGTIGEGDVGKVGGVLREGGCVGVGAGLWVVWVYLFAA